MRARTRSKACAGPLPYQNVTLASSEQMLHHYADVCCRRRWAAEQRLYSHKATPAATSKPNFSPLPLWPIWPMLITDATGLYHLPPNQTSRPGAPWERPQVTGLCALLSGPIDFSQSARSKQQKKAFKVIFFDWRLGVYLFEHPNPKPKALCMVADDNKTRAATSSHHSMSVPAGAKPPATKEFIEHEAQVLDVDSAPLVSPEANFPLLLSSLHEHSSMAFSSCIYLQTLQVHLKDIFLQRQCLHGRAARVPTSRYQTCCCPNIYNILLHALLPVWFRPGLPILLLQEIADSMEFDAGANKWTTTRTSESSHCLGC